MSTLAFIGAGNMAEAIARGLLRINTQILAADPSPDRQRLFNELNIRCVSNSAEIVPQADIVILATKPFVMTDALQQIKPLLKPNALIISIAAGISTKFIEQTLGNDRRVIRVMPNTPMLVGKGISALARGSFATEDDLLTAEQIFAAAGKTIRVPESAMDAVTALSGSGPAYIFFLTEAMTQAGITLGLTDLQAAQLARQTVIGATALLEQSPDTPAELRRKVTTPNGTTHAAIESMQKQNFTDLITNALTAAADRSKELGK
ncbi:MAG: pyrroline-5-carboxylate reductase [Phycisphaerales bacterium]|nr:pyrroline-5-carboxylate reductase [Phycisphaerales bacterium]